MTPIDEAKADARNAARSLAARAERDHPIAAACILEAFLPRIEDGVLHLSYGPGKRFAYRKLKPLEKDLERYTDLKIAVDQIEP